MRSTVDLPHPEGPSRATISLPRTVMLISSNTRSGFPLGKANSCVICRASLKAATACVVATTAIMGSLWLSFAQRISLLRQPVAAPPHEAVEEHHNCGHDQYAGGEHRVIFLVRRFHDLRPQARCYQPGLVDILGYDTRVPRAARRRHPTGNQVRKHGREIERLEALPGAKPVAAGG